EGEKAVAFSSVARATGLAGASLVQRYGPLPQMVEAALAWAWDEMDRLAAMLEAEVPAGATGGSGAGAKAAQALLKALGERGQPVPLTALLAASLRSAALRQRAGDWRARVLAMLAARLRDRDLAAMVFAAWQGQVLWDGLGERGFRLKDLVKKLG
ncbi:MAG: hypothetical protein B7Y02_18210, partial [Rhodobacterales bacterium 17-64-5]